MSDHPKEADRNLKRIRICNDIFFDVFRLLAPAKVGLEMALVSHRFDTVVDTHFKSRKWALGKLEINSENIVKTNEDGSEETLPFPQKELPNSIVGFSSVDIYAINSCAIAFLQCIGRILEKDVCLKLHIYGESNWNNFTTSVWPLLNVFTIIKIHFHSSVFQNFRRYISPSILCDCPNLGMISFDGLFLQFPPDDSEGSSDGQALCKWLHTPCADGQPKVLRICWGDLFPMGALKKTFLNATTSVSFIICLRSETIVGPFEVVNSLTREQFTSREIEDGDDNYWQLIERSPIDKNEEQWEKEAMHFGENGRWNVLGMYL